MAESTVRLPLYRIAHARSGDKADRSNIAVFPYRDEDYGLLARRLTVAAVKRFFGANVKGPIVRYDLPKLKALNFVLDGALDGGVNDSLAADTHGKSRGMVFLCLEIDVPAHHWAAKGEEPWPAGGKSA